MTETTNSSSSGNLSLDNISDIPVNISVVLGKTVMTINQLMKLGKGAVIELNRRIGEPIDIHVNGRLVARGEVVIIGEQIGITLTEILREKDENKLSTS